MDRTRLELVTLSRVRYEQCNPWGSSRGALTCGDSGTRSPSRFAHGCWSSGAGYQLGYDTPSQRRRTQPDRPPACRTELPGTISTAQGFRTGCSPRLMNTSTITAAPNSSKLLGLLEGQWTLPGPQVRNPPRRRPSRTRPAPPKIPQLGRTITRWQNEIAARASRSRRS